MPHRIVCPKCARAGLVRIEHILKGSKATQSFYCGACQATWEMPEVDLSPHRKPPQKPKISK